MMKRTLAAMAAAMLLAGVLSGCSGSVYYEDPWNEGNVSTTDDGRVNGTNRDLERGMYPNTNRVTTPGTSTGTGMTGGR